MTTCPYPERSTCPEVERLMVEVRALAERLARVEVRTSPAVPPDQRDHAGYVADWREREDSRGQ